MRTATAIFLAMACLAGTGCVSTKPVHYYTLEAPAPPANQANPDGLVLLVGDVSTPEELQDGRIRYRTGSNEAGAYEYHRWTERPGSMVRTALIGALRDSGKYRYVLEAGSASTGDYLLRGRLGEFDEVDQSAVQTRISLNVELVDRKTNQVVWDRTVERTEPVSAKTVAGVVQSLDRNLRQVTAEVAASVGTFLAGRR